MLRAKAQPKMMKFLISDVLPCIAMEEERYCIKQRYLGGHHIYIPYEYLVTCFHTSGLSSVPLHYIKKKLSR